MKTQDTRDALNGTQGMKNASQKVWRVTVDGTTVFQASSKRSASEKAAEIEKEYAFGREVKVC